ncbi:MAG: FtsW/RodA/SpoVE family cell cycle protein [Oscillospiraceae bacterium]|nr:FtsW/RodA/SpoVE family cell cycle protein [Oscillospiraceae bacterium]
MKKILHHVFKYIKRLDIILLLLCLTASAFCVYLLYTISLNGINPSVVTPRTWRTQLYATIAGLACSLIIAAINYNILSKIWFTYAGVALILSLLLFTPLGMSTPGSTEVNWLDLGFMQIQPSEFLTVAFIMTMATHLHKVGDKMNRLPHMALLCLHVLVPVIMLVLQDNTGAPLLIILIFILMLFVAGLSWKYMVAGAVAIPLAAMAFWNFYAKDYHKMRILVVLDKELQQTELQGAFHQQNRSLIALGSGGLTGQGLSGGEYISIFGIHNDFMFAYIGMTLGFVGCILTLLLVMSICIKLLSTASLAKDLLGRLICAGAFATVFFHAVINVGMVVAVTPVVGVPLPFVSAGGSSTLALYIAIGLVLSVRAHREKKYHMFYTEKE